jgi:hypothetical protein
MSLITVLTVVLSLMLPPDIDRKMEDPDGDILNTSDVGSPMEMSHLVDLDGEEVDLKRKGHG